jgi:septation ring formation regulator EzrA
MFAIHWTITVQVPQLDALQEDLRTVGAQIVDALQGIRDEIAHLGTQQASGSDAIATQLTAIADEISQFNAESIQQEDLDALAAQIREAATVAENQAATLRANTAQIAGIVPDASEGPPA